MKAFVLMLVIAVALPSLVQEKATVGDFRKSPNEHIINQLESPFVVRSVKGIINRKQGDQRPLPNVLFEIQGPGTERRIRWTTTDEHGRFKMGHIAIGTYRFKASLDGFQSVIGTITVSKKAGKTDEIKVELGVGV